MVYGTTIRIPGELAFPNPTPLPDTLSFAIKLSTAMQTVKSIPSRAHTCSSYLPPSLSSASHVLVRQDVVRTSLQQPYDGPYKVIKRSLKYYTLRINNKDINISIDQLKPAFLDKELQVPDDSPYYLPHPLNLLPLLLVLLSLHYLLWSQQGRLLTQATGFIGPNTWPHIVNYYHSYTHWGEYCGVNFDLRWGSL